MEDLRIAVVGLGMGMNRANIVHTTPGARLVAVADLLADRRQRAVDKFGCRAHASFDELLAHSDDIDCIYVMTESGRHADMGMAAARAGKHVISTKPIDISVDKAIEYCRVCEACGVHLLVDFQMRYTPAVQRMRAAVQQGALGQPLFGEVRMKWWRGEDYYEGWHGTWALDGGGSVMNQAIHFIDILQYCLGDVSEVYAYSGVHAHVNCETEDMTNALLKFTNGAEGMIHTQTNFRGKAYDMVEINGTQGAVGVTLDTLSRWEFVPPAGRTETWDAQTGATKPAAEGAYEPELQLPETPASAVEDAIRTIRGGAAPFCPGWDGIRSISIGLALYESARSGRPVQPRMSFR
ncbi:MAG: Gfo/Idh/MocA family oxidoreductase [Fimbriimonadaceae bacterium]|nr:Gfo/Idh/MocA family oxidoreductase [Fimbriimonadaceae bacterium]